VFDGHICCVERVLQCGDIIPEEGHDKGEKNGGKEVNVLRGLVEERWVLEDGEATGADCEEVEPLPKDISQPARQPYDMMRWLF
jgi:hypothetical protein